MEQNIYCYSELIILNKRDWLKTSFEKNQKQK
jgi:hypothetical protein